MAVFINCPECRTGFSVLDGLMGAVVECPNCATRLEVPKTQVPDAQAPKEEEDDPFELRLAPLDERPAATLSVDTPSPKATRRKRPATSEPQPETDEPASVSSCPECGEGLGSDGMLCVACGYHLVLRRKVTAELDDLRDDKKAGFDHWLHSQLETNESIESVLLWVDIVVAAVLLLTLATGGVFGTIFAVAVGAAYITWRVWNWRSRSKAGQLLGLRGPLWTAALATLRTANWRTLADGGRPLRVFDLRGRTDADTELAESDLSDIEVVDCEGSSLSDAGLLVLEGAKQLKYLTVRRSQVSREALKRFQERRKRCWIWC